MSGNFFSTHPLSEDYEEEEDEVLDFSSGSAKVVKDTTKKVKVASEDTTNQAGGSAFTRFRYDNKYLKHFSQSFNF